MTFEFATAARIVFGAGTLAQIGGLAHGLGRCAFIVTGRSGVHSVALTRQLEGAGVSWTLYAADGEPTLGTVASGVAAARKLGCDVVIGCGGGSAIDAGKAIAAMLANPGELLDYLEVVGRGRPLPNSSIPFIAIPTTAGTGAEVTKNAVLGAPEQRVKVSLRGPQLLPRVALVDPELTAGLPPEIAANCGLDALTQLLEAFVCRRANPMTDALCEQGIRLAARSLRKSVHESADLAARTDMSMAAMLSGMALANAGLGAVHGFAAPIGGMFAAPHGAVCAALLPHVWKANWQRVSRDGTDAQRERFKRAAELLCDHAEADAADGMAWIERLCDDLCIKPLGHFGVGEADMPEIARRAAQASSMKANPVELSSGELAAILRSAQ